MSKKNKKKVSNGPKKTTTTTTTTTVVTTTVTTSKSLDTHYLLVLDRSGSMQSCWGSTIEGLNEQLGTIRGLNKQYPEQRYFLTLVAFDDKIETIIDDKPIEEVSDFTGSEFPPRGMTSLHDAMGISINSLKAKISKKDNDNNSISTALVVIMTDGHENNSKEHNAVSVKKLVDELNTSGAWTFSYMGANQDAVLTASKFGIASGNAVNYSSTTAGASAAYQTLSRAVSSRAKMSNIAYTNSSSFNAGNVTLDSLSLNNDALFSSVIVGDTIGEDTSKLKDDDTANTDKKA